MAAQIVYRTMSMKELAGKYFPYVCSNSATRSLSRWIHIDGSLLIQLTRIGYKSYSKTLTPRQVQIIVEHFGMPAEDL